MSKQFRAVIAGGASRKCRYYLEIRAALCASTSTDILTAVLPEPLEEGKLNWSSDDAAVLRRAGEASVLILTSLAEGPKHGYALIQDIRSFSGHKLGPGTLYGALDRLEALELIQSLPAQERRQPYRITRAGSEALAAYLDSVERVSSVGRLRLSMGPAL